MNKSIKKVRLGWKEGWRGSGVSSLKSGGETDSVDGKVCKNSLTYSPMHGQTSARPKIIQQNINQEGNQFFFFSQENLMI